MEHSIEIQLHGNYNEIYQSKQFNKIILAELSEENLCKRHKLLKILKPITNLLTDEWDSTVNLNIGDEYYSETFWCKHNTSVSQELSVMITSMYTPEFQTRNSSCTWYDFISSLNSYLKQNKQLHTEKLHKVYGRVCKNLLKLYGVNCRIAECVDESRHAFYISPRVGSDSELFTQVILTPKLRGRSDGPWNISRTPYER